MASKTSKKANAAAEKAKQPNYSQMKDDGSRWTVHDRETGEQVYAGSGVAKGDAMRLATGLVRPAEIREV